jgi:hypothetical protein
MDHLKLIFWKNNFKQTIGIYKNNFDRKGLKWCYGYAIPCGDGIFLV